MESPEAGCIRDDLSYGFTKYSSHYNSALTVQLTHFLGLKGLYELCYLSIIQLLWVDLFCQVQQRSRFDKSYFEIFNAKANIMLHLNLTDWTLNHNNTIQMVEIGHGENHGQSSLLRHGESHSPLSLFSHGESHDQFSLLS